MSNPEKEEALKEYNDNISWLHSAVPPDDIYEFAQQSLMCSEYFLHILNTHINMPVLLEKDEHLVMWIKNFLKVYTLQSNKTPCVIGVTMLGQDEI